MHFINNFYIYEKKGVLTELFLTNPNNEHINCYDYIFFILDDVKILNVDIIKMIEVKKKYNIEIMSTKILKSSHKFMHTHNDLTINNFLEVYLLLLKPLDFNKFCSMYTIQNKWMWGCDLLFGYYNIRAGVLNTYVAEHVLTSMSIKWEACKLMNEYFKTRTKYNCIEDVKKEFNPIIETIKL